MLPIAADPPAYLRLAELRQGSTSVLQDRVDPIVGVTQFVSMIDHRHPETEAYDGMIGVALIYSAAESSFLGEAVTSNDVMNMKIQEYQNEIGV